MISYEARLPHMRIFLLHMMLFYHHMRHAHLIWSHMISYDVWWFLNSCMHFFSSELCALPLWQPSPFWKAPVHFLKDPFCRNQIWQIQIRSPFAGPVLLWEPFCKTLLWEPFCKAHFFFQQLRLTYSCPSSSPSFSSSGLCATQCHLCCCWPPAMLWAVAVALPLPSGSCPPLWACLLAGQGNAMCTQQMVQWSHQKNHNPWIYSGICCTKNNVKVPHQTLYIIYILNVHKTAISQFPW